LHLIFLSFFSSFLLHWLLPFGDSFMMGIDALSVSCSYSYW
jgi:hypothetical protein